MVRNSIILVMAVSGTAWCSAQGAQTSKELGVQEQSWFSSEQADAGESVKRPVKIPPDALRVLATDDGISSCMENEGMSRDQLPASWFVASQIHLSGPDETDLVVLPNLKSGPSPRATRPVGCFIGANTAEFWILRKTARGYHLALHAGGHDLRILTSRTNGLRDIQTSTILRAGQDVASETYIFGGRAYQKRESAAVPAPKPD